MLLVLISLATAITGILAAWLTIAFEFPFRRVLAVALVLPLAMPTLTAVWILVFVMAMQEVSASILLYSNRSITISVTVYTLWDQGNLGGLAALSVLHLAVMFLLVGVVLRRRQGGFVPA